MIKCPNCGNVSEADSRFCDRCGAGLAEKQSRTTETTPSKDPAIALILAMICPGLGHLYCERYGKAWMFLLLAGFAASIVLNLFYNLSYMSDSSLLPSWQRGSVFLGLLVLAGVWIWNLADSFYIVEKMRRGDIGVKPRDPSLRLLMYLGFILAALLLGCPAFGGLVALLSGGRF